MFEKAYKLSKIGFESRIFYLAPIGVPLRSQYAESATPTFNTPGGEYEDSKDDTETEIVGARYLP